MKRQPFDLPDLDAPKPYVYALPTPNEGVNSIYDLTFGRGWYEDVRGKRTPQNEKFYEEKESGNWWLRRDWRTLLTPPDPHALMYIWQDCDGKFLLERNKRYLTMELFDPDLLEIMLIKHPKVIQLVQEICTKNYASHAFKPLMSFLIRFFRTDYRKAFEQAELDRYVQYPMHRDTESRLYIPHTFEDKFTVACKQFDKAADLVAKFLVRHRGLYPEIWVPMLAQHADLSEYWKQFTSQSLGQPQPVKRLAAVKKDRGTQP